MLELPDTWFRGTVGARRIANAFNDDTARMPRAGERALLGFILPAFQRPPVWTIHQKIQLIESIWEGLPIGAYVSNRVHDPDNACSDWLLDGQQRWTAISEYAADAFPVFGGYFSEATRIQRRTFEDRPIGEIVTNLTDPAECLRVYTKLAYGGTAHAPMPDDDAGPAAPGPR